MLKIPLGEGVPSFFIALIGARFTSEPPHTASYHFFLFLLLTMRAVAGRVEVLLSILVVQVLSFAFHYLKRIFVRRQQPKVSAGTTKGDFG